MYTPTLLTLATLLTAALSFPTAESDAPTLNYAVSNDLTGAQAPSTIRANGTPVTFRDVFRGTRLDRNGAIIATSMLSTSNGAGIFCTVKDSAGNHVGFLNERQTWVDLDGKVGAFETDVSAFTMVCTA